METVEYWTEVIVDLRRRQAAYTVDIECANVKLYRATCAEHASKLRARCEVLSAYRDATGQAIKNCQDRIGSLRAIAAIDAQ